MAEHKRNMAWEDLAKKYPEHFTNQPKLSIRFLCQCKKGHVFDYRERIKYLKNDKYYAPCQGKCPICGESNFSFIGNAENIYR